MAKEFVDRGYIVVTSGCMAMDMSLYTDVDGKTIWEQYPGGFDGRNICNTGSCVSNANIATQPLRSPPSSPTAITGATSTISQTIS